MKAIKNIFIFTVLAIFFSTLFSCKAQYGCSKIRVKRKVKRYKPNKIFPKKRFAKKFGCVLAGQDAEELIEWKNRYSERFITNRPKYFTFQY